MNELILSLQRVPASVLSQWGIVALVALLIIAILIRAEAQHFRQQGQGAAWLKLRIATLPILAISIVAVIGTYTATGIKGMEALAVAYLALFSVGPLVHFGLHWLLGKMLGLGRGQTAWIAFSGLLMIGIVPATAGMLMPHLQTASRALSGTGATQVDNAPLAPSPYREIAARHLALPNHEAVWAIHYQASAGIELIRVDVESSNYRTTNMLQTETATMCHRNNDLHLLWPVDRPLPLLHVYWKNPAGVTMLSSWTPQPQASASEPFLVIWETSVLHLPVAVSRSALSVAWERPEGSPLVRSLREISPGTDCAPQEIVLPEQPIQGRPNTLYLRTDHAQPKGMAWADFRRSDAASN